MQGIPRKCLCICSEWRFWRRLRVRVINNSEALSFWSLPPRGRGAAVRSTVKTIRWIVFSPSGSNLWLRLGGGGVADGWGEVDYWLLLPLCKQNTGRKLFYPLISHFVTASPEGGESKNNALRDSSRVAIVNRSLFRPYLLRARGGISAWGFSRAERENFFTRTYPPTYLSTMHFFLPFFVLFFLLYKVNEIVPPPRFCQPFCWLFHTFFAFCRICGSILTIFPSYKQKVIHTPLDVDNFSFFSIWFDIIRFEENFYFWILPFYCFNRLE